MISTALYSSKRDDWATPRDFFDRLNREFHFQLDAAASAENAKCERFITAEQDALSQPWLGGPVFCNPPYGRNIGAWMAKAAETARAGTTVVCLVHARTDTRWWHEHVWDERYDRTREGVEVRFVRGRLRFEGAEAGAPFPSVVVVFRPPRCP